MGGSSSSPGKTDIANAAVENAAKAWEQVSTDLGAAIASSAEAEDALRVVMQRYDATERGKGLFNSVKQLGDNFRKKMKGSSLGPKQRKRLISLQSEVFELVSALRGSETATSAAGEELATRLSEFTEYLDRLRSLTSASAAKKAAFVHMIL